MTTHPDLTTAAAYLDEAMKAIALAKQALLGGAGGALFVSSGPDLAAAEASPGNPYGSTKHGEFTAGSAAGAAACGAHSEPQYVQDPASYFTCELPAGHAGDHVVHEADGGMFLHWPQDAGSAAGVAGGADTCPVCESPSRTLRRGYGDEDGLHPCVDPWHDAAGGAEPKGPAFRPDQLLGARHDSPDQTGPVTDWETAEPGGGAR